VPLLCAPRPPPPPPAGEIKDMRESLGEGEFGSHMLVGGCPAPPAASTASRTPVHARVPTSSREEANNGDGCEQAPLPAPVLPGCRTSTSVTM
jgi:hypothetical protein